MATSYKIRLKRFNGLDYDTLNLSSENIIRNNGNTVEQEFNNIIPSSNGILKNDNGVFNVATLGTDYTSVDDSLISSTTKTYSISKQKDTFVPFNMLGIVIEGNSTPSGAEKGQYVIVKNSTITGITDGLYTAVNALSPSTDVTAADLTPVTGGGLNNVMRAHAYSFFGANGTVFGAYELKSIVTDISTVDWSTVDGGYPLIYRYVGNAYFAVTNSYNSNGVLTIDITNLSNQQQTLILGIYFYYLG